MGKTKATLEYRDADDRSYGLAGMITMLSAMNALELIRSVSLDAEGPMVEFTDSYYFTHSPNFSPKGVWETLRRNFYITSAMVMGNVMSRWIVRDREIVPTPLLMKIRRTMEEEAEEMLGLEADETDALFHSLLEQNAQLFHNPQVKRRVMALRQRLEISRSLTAGEIIYELRNL